MTRTPDVALLAFGAVRVCFWLAGLYVGLRVLRVLRTAGTMMLIGYLLAAFGASVFALSNAGYEVPEALFTAATITSTPAAALVVTSNVLLVTYLVRLRRHLAEGVGIG